MNTFNWLLIGHLVGDWLLQNDWMARSKKQGLLTWAGMVHFAIYTVAVMGALWLSGITDKNPIFYLGLSTIIFVSHWLIDAAGGAERWMDFYHQTNREPVRAMVDQTLHLLVLVWLTIYFGGG